MKPAYAPEVRAEAVRLVRAGASFQAAANVVGASATTVAVWCRRVGVDIRRPPISPDEVAEMQRRFRAGESIAAIARAMSRTSSSVAKHTRDIRRPVPKPKVHIGATPNEIAKMRARAAAGDALEDIAHDMAIHLDIVTRECSSEDLA